MDSLIQVLNDTPRLKYLGKTKLKQALKGRRDIPANAIDRYFAESDLKQVFSGVNKRPRELQYKITAMPKSFQIDVVYFGYPKRRANKGCAYALMLVDILSRKCWLYPMKSQSMDEILRHYETFLTSVGISNVHTMQTRVKMIMGDDQFSAKRFQAFNGKLGISLYTNIAKDDHVVGDSDRLGILDRLVGTLKRQLEMRYVEVGVEGDWQKYIEQIVLDYNQTIHSTLHMTPSEAWELPEAIQIERFTLESNYNRTIDRNTKNFTPGDRVRILENPDTFTKGTKPKWSTTVHIVRDRTGYRYTVDGLANNSRRTFKSNELLPVAATARDLAVDKTATRKEKVRKRIESSREGISMNTTGTAGITTRNTYKRVTRSSIKSK
jgi:hypothetical protein